MATNYSRLLEKNQGISLVRLALVAVAAVVALVVSFSFAPAAQAQAPVSPLAPTNHVTVTFRIEVVEAGPVPTDAVVHGAVRCPNPRSKFIGSGINVEVTLVPGYWHFNLAADGQGEGIEENVLVRYAGDPLTVIVHEGAVWWYRESCFAADLNGLWFRTLRDSTDDYWPAELPSFLAIDGVTLLEPPVEGLIRESAPMATTEYVWPVQTIVVETEESEIEEPAAGTNAPEFDFDAGVIAQGEDKIAPALGYCELAWWIRGDSREYVTWFVATELADVGVFNGTLSCWPTLPSVNDLNVEHDFRTVAEAETAGIQFSPAVEDFEPAD